MSISITVATSNGADIEKAILEVFAAKLNSGFNKAVTGIRSRLAEEVDRGIRGSPEYSSLLSGNLWHELGVTNPERATSDIISTIQDSIYVKVNRVVRLGSRLTGGMSLGILQADYRDVLGLPIASFISEHNFQIDWLRWLLLEGDSIINGEYHFEAGHRERSRTGDGVMITTGTWRVPPEFSGVLSDNWLTRALVNVGPSIKPILIKEIKRQL